MASREEREALARGGMEAFNDRDLPRMLAALSPEVEVYASPELVNAGTYHGHDGFTAWITTWMEAWEEISSEVTDTVPVGDRHIVTVIHQVGRGREGIEVSMDLAFLFDVNEEGTCAFLAMLPTGEAATRMAEERESD